MFVTIRRVGVGSAFKVGALMLLLFWAVFGIIFLVLQGSLLASMVNSSNFPARGAGLGLGTLCVFYLIGMVIYTIIGGIVGAAYAFFYNLVSGWVGGLELELERGADNTRTVSVTSEY